MLHPIMKLTSSLEVTFTNNIHTTCAYQQHGVKIDSRSGVTDTIGNDGSVNKDVSKSGEVFHRGKINYDENNYKSTFITINYLILLSLFLLLLVLLVIIIDFLFKKLS